MNSKEVKGLLDRYWMCQTSIEEEQLLRDFFSGEDVSDEFLAHRPLFLLGGKLNSIQADKQLKSRIISEFNWVKEEKRTRRTSLYPLLKVAASILIVLSAGIGIYTHYQQKEFIDETFSETYTSPEDAIIETRAALSKIATTLSKKQDLLNDSTELEPNQEDTIQAE